MQFIDLSDQINDFSDTAALMENMDLIITVDTSTAHLAGALNRPVWTFVHYSNDWRWLENDNGITIWYPSMEIYRQTSLNDWTRIIKKMATDLECLAELYL
jgi:ADP-heptose:LPS heptosyltransferase